MHVQFFALQNTFPCYQILIVYVDLEWDCDDIFIISINTKNPHLKLFRNFDYS